MTGESAEIGRGIGPAFFDEWIGGRLRLGFGFRFRLRFRVGSRIVLAPVPPLYFAVVFATACGTSTKSDEGGSD